MRSEALISLGVGQMRKNIQNVVGYQILPGQDPNHWENLRVIQKQTGQYHSHSCFCQIYAR